MSVIYLDIILLYMRVGWKVHIKCHICYWWLFWWDHCNTYRRNVWCARRTMLKIKPHLVTFYENILVGLWTFQSFLVCCSVGNTSSFKFKFKKLKAQFQCFFIILYLWWVYLRWFFRDIACNLVKQYLFIFKSLSMWFFLLCMFLFLLLLMS